MCNHLIDYLGNIPLGTAFNFDEFAKRYLDSCSGQKQQVHPEVLFLHLYSIHHVHDIENDGLVKKCRAKYEEIQDNFLNAQRGKTVLTMQQRIFYIRDYFYIHECPVETAKQFGLDSDAKWKPFIEKLREDQETHSRILYDCLGFIEEDHHFERKKLINFEIWCWKSLAIISRDIKGNKRHLSWIDVIMEWSTDQEERKKLALRLFNLFTLYRVKNLFTFQFPVVPSIGSPASEGLPPIETRFTTSPSQIVLEEKDVLHYYMVERTPRELMRTFEIPLPNETMVLLSSLFFRKESLRITTLHFLDQLDDQLRSKETFGFAAIYQKYSDLLNVLIPKNGNEYLHALLEKCLLFMLFQNRIRASSTKQIDQTIVYSLIEKLSQEDKETLLSEFKLNTQLKSTYEPTLWPTFLELLHSNRFSNLEILILLLQMLQHDAPASLCSLKQVFTFIQLVEQYLNCSFTFHQISSLLSGPYINVEVIRRIKNQIEWRETAFKEGFFVSPITFEYLNDNLEKLREHLIPPESTIDYTQAFAFRARLIENISKFSPFHTTYVPSLHKVPIDGNMPLQRFIPSDGPHFGIFPSSIHSWYVENDTYFFESTYTDCKEQVRCHTVNVKLDLSKKLLDEKPEILELFKQLIDPLCKNHVSYNQQTEKSDPLLHLLTCLDESESWALWRDFKEKQETIGADQISIAFSNFYKEVKVNTRRILQRFMEDTSLPWRPIKELKLSLDLPKEILDEYPLILELFEQLFKSISNIYQVVTIKVDSTEKDLISKLFQFFKNDEGSKAWEEFKLSNKTIFENVDNAFCKYFRILKINSNKVMQQFWKPLEELQIMGDVYPTATGWSLLPPTHPEAFNPAYSIERVQYEAAVEQICNLQIPVENKTAPMLLQHEKINLLVEMKILRSVNKDEVEVNLYIVEKGLNVSYKAFFPSSIPYKKMKALLFSQIMLLKYRFYLATSQKMSNPSINP